MYVENTSQLTRNDDLSSLKVTPGCCVILYKDGDYKGDSKKVCKDLDIDDLGDEWNDQVSSIVIQKRTEGNAEKNFTFSNDSCALVTMLLIKSNEGKSVEKLIQMFSL